MFELFSSNYEAEACQYFPSDVRFIGLQVLVLTRIIDPTRYQTYPCSWINRRTGGSLCVPGSLHRNAVSKLMYDSGPAPSTEHHSSFYPWSWLRQHTYDPPQQKDYYENEFVCPLLHLMLSYGSDYPGRYFGVLRSPNHRHPLHTKK